MSRQWWAQHGEDKICSELFEAIGETNRVAVEFGALDGWHHSNTAHFRGIGWQGYLWDSGPLDPIVAPAVITAENVNAIFEAAGVPEQFDLLSIDIDGNDLWVWKAIRYQPRVVIIEYNPKWGVGKSRTVPYDPARRWDGTDFYGASARALVRLGKEKGYTLAAVTRSNLIFVRAGLMSVLPISSVPDSRKVKPVDPAERKWVAYP
jgi:hypothetical protein